MEDMGMKSMNARRYATLLAAFALASCTAQEAGTSGDSQLCGVDQPIPAVQPIAPDVPENLRSLADRPWRGGFNDPQLCAVLFFTNVWKDGAVDLHYFQGENRTYQYPRFGYRRESVKIVDNSFSISLDRPFVFTLKQDGQGRYIEVVFHSRGGTPRRGTLRQ
jgi:hypothetical protein